MEVFDSCFLLLRTSCITYITFLLSFFLYFFPNPLPLIDHPIVQSHVLKIIPDPSHFPLPLLT